MSRLNVKDQIDAFDKVEVPACVLLHVLGGIKQGALTSYATNDLLVRGSKPGTYKLAQTVSRVTTHLRQQARGRLGRTDDVDAIKSKADLQAAQQRLAEIRASMLSRELISLPEVEDAWREIAQRNKQLFLSFPARVRFDLGLNAVQQKQLETLARDLLHECATEGKLRLPATD